MASSGHRIGKSKKGTPIPPLLTQPLQQQLVLVFQHFFQTFARDKTVGRPIDRITEGHVIGRHALGHCAGRPARLKKPTCHLLPRSNLRNRAVVASGEINLPGLFVRREDMRKFIHALARLTQGFPRIENRHGKRAAGPAKFTPTRRPRLI